MAPNLSGVLVAITMTVSEKIEQQVIEDFDKTQAHFLEAKPYLRSPR